MKVYTETQIQELANEALHTAIQTIQSRLGVNSRDCADYHFQGHTERVIEDILRGYIRTEIQWGGE